MAAQQQGSDALRERRRELMPDLVETHGLDAIEFSRETQDEITRILRELDRDSRFHSVDCGILIDMSGLGLVVWPE